MHRRIGLIAVLAITGAVAVGTVAAVAVADEGGTVRESLTSYEEVPALSTPGVGQFRASIDVSDEEISYRLSVQGLESAWQQAHIHFENASNNGPIYLWLCTNLGNGPAGTQACPAAGGTISGTLRPADVTAGAALQGIAAGEFAEAVRAIRSGASYVNVHSTTRPGGEIRAQLAKGNDDE